MIKPERKEQIDKTIKRHLKLGHATFPFIPTQEERYYFADCMARHERWADRRAMLKIIGFTIAGLCAIILGCWVIISKG